MLSHFTVRQILIPKPLHARTVEVVADAELFIRCRIKTGIGDRIIQQLSVDGGTVAEFLP